MKSSLRQLVWIVAGVLLLALSADLQAPDQAQAAFANTGLPVRCYNIGFSSSMFLTCVTPPGSGVSFSSSQRVPAGYYFAITDILVTPVSGTGTAVTDFYLEDCYGESSIQSINHFRHLGGETFSEHYAAPMWVLLADHRLQVVAQAANEQNYDIRVNGLLLTNLYYLAVVSAP